MLSTTSFKHTRVGPSGSQVNVLSSLMSRHQTLSPLRPLLSPYMPASLMKTPKKFQNKKQSPKNNHTRFFFSCPSSSSESTTSPHIGPQMAKTAAISTPTRSFSSSALANLLPVTPSPHAPDAPDAPLRRQGPSHPRFAALQTRDWVRPPVPLTPLTRRLQFAAVYRRIAAPAHSPSSSHCSVPADHHGDLALYSPLVFSSSACSRSPSLANELPDDLCSDRSGLISYNQFVANHFSKQAKRQAKVEGWLLDSHSPFSCESAVVSPLASSVADSWSARSTSIATVSSGSPLAYRLPVLKRGHTLLGALAGKRTWRLDSVDKEAFLNALHRDDPHNLLQTPDNVARTASFHKWIADIPTPDIPSVVQPHRSPSLSPSLFSDSPFSSASLAEEASPPLSPSPMPPSPSPSGSSDSFAFLYESSPLASPSPRRLPAASIRSEQTCSPVAKSPKSPTLTDALAKLKALVEAGPPSPIARSPTPITRSPTPITRSPTPIARSPSIVTRSPSPSPSPIPPPVAATVDNHLVLSAPIRSLKRKLPQDASPPPRRTRPAVTRFEPPTPVFHFAPTLPESLPSFPIVLPAMPGAFPTDMPTDLHLEPTPVTRSPASSSVSWKAVAGIAAGAFALGLVVSRYLF